MTTQNIEPVGTDEVPDGTVIRDTVVPGEFQGDESGAAYYDPEQIYTTDTNPAPAEAPLPAPAPVAPVAPPVQTEMEQNFARISAENHQLRQVGVQQANQARRGELTQQAESYRQQLEVRGYTSEQAREIAQRELQHVTQAMDVQQRHESDRVEDSAKGQTARQYAQLYGVSQEDLMRYDSPQAMKIHGETQKQLRDMQAQLAQSKQAQVPAQQFNGPPGPSAATTSRSRELDQLMAKPNPNDADLQRWGVLLGS